jgi:hypothetical protein
MKTQKEPFSLDNIRTSAATSNTKWQLLYYTADDAIHTDHTYIHTYMYIYNRGVAAGQRLRGKREEILGNTYFL